MLTRRELIPLPKRLLIIIPAYNEETAIAPLIEALRECGATEYADLLVINDSSTDQTDEILERLHVCHVNNVFNLGYGTALQLGYKYAQKHSYDYVIQMDADGQHDVCNVERLYHALIGDDAPDIVIGSRFLPDSVSFPISKVKRFAISIFSLLIKLITGQRVQDPTSGLQGLSRRAFSYYAGFSHFNSRYPDANMIIQMIVRGYSVREIPAVMHERESGKSMHAGFIAPLTYMFLMTLSILAVAWRENAEKRQRARQIKNG